MAASRGNLVSPAPASRFTFKSAVSASSLGSSMGMVIEEFGTDDAYKQVGKMVLVVLIPVLSLIAKTSVSFAESLGTQQEASVLSDVMEHALFASEGISLLQRERGLTAVYLGAQTDDFAVYRKLASARLNSNEFLLRFTVYDTIKVPGSDKVLVTGRDIMEHLNVIRDEVDALRINVSLLSVVDRYTDINKALIKDSLRVSLVPSRQDIWPLVVAFGTLARAIDIIGIQRGLGGAAFSACTLGSVERNLFAILNSKYETLIDTVFQFYSPLRKQYNDDFAKHGDLSIVVERQKGYVLNNSALGHICRVAGGGQTESTLWFDSVTKYMTLLTNIQQSVTTQIRARIPVIMSDSRAEMGAYLTVMITVSITSLLLGIWYSIRLNDMNKKVRDAVIKIRGRAELVQEETKKTDFLLYQMMPVRVADTLKHGLEVVPEWFDKVTIYFSDIMGWADICTKSSPHQIVTLLNNLYREFDDIIEKFEVYKVETIADSYMCVSGLPDKTPDHASIIAQLALEMMQFAKTFNIKHLPGVPLKLRIGFHSGPCVAGVVGTKMPRYCLFGDTVNTASRMETNGEAFKIHITEASQRLLDKATGFEMTYRGRIPIKGKGDMATYWLLRSTTAAIKKRVKISNGDGD